jgi:hypothetical protein
VPEDWHWRGFVFPSPSGRGQGEGIPMVAQSVGFGVSYTAYTGAVKTASQYIEKVLRTLSFELHVEKAWFTAWFQKFGGIFSIKLTILL